MPGGAKSKFLWVNNSVCCLFEKCVPEVWPQIEQRHRIKSERPHSVDVKLIYDV